MFDGKDKEASRWTVKKCQEITLPETNIAPENGWLEDFFSFWETLFSGAMLGSGRVNMFIPRGKTQQVCTHGI